MAGSPSTMWGWEQVCGCWRPVVAPWRAGAASEPSIQRQQQRVSHVLAEHRQQPAQPCAVQGASYRRSMLGAGGVACRLTHPRTRYAPPLLPPSCLAASPPPVHTALLQHKGWVPRCVAACCMLRVRGSRRSDQAACMRAAQPARQRSEPYLRCASRPAAEGCWVSQQRHRQRRVQQQC